MKVVRVEQKATSITLLLKLGTQEAVMFFFNSDMVYFCRLGKFWVRLKRVRGVASECVTFDLNSCNFSQTWEGACKQDDRKALSNSIEVIRCK